MSKDFSRQGFFPTTQWSMVYRAGQGTQDGGHHALEELLGRYLPALRLYLLATRRVPPQDVDDLLQSFVLDKVIQERLVSHASEFRGRFRTFLLAVLDNYLHNHHRYQKAKRRSPAEPVASVEAQPIEDKSLEAPHHQFDVAWGREVLRQAMEEMRRQCQETSRADLWEIFESRVWQPIVDQKPAAAYDDLVAKYGYKTPADAYNALITAKRTFQRCLRAVISQYARDETEIEEELRDLRQAFSRNGA